MIYDKTVELRTGSAMQRSVKPSKARQSVSCNAYSPNFMQMCLQIALLNRILSLIKLFFYYTNKWSNSRPENFGLINHGLNK